MTQKFVRYSPDVEQIEPNFDQTLQTVLDGMKQHMRGSLQAEGIGRVVRDAHAKGYGLARAEFFLSRGDQSSRPCLYWLRTLMPGNHNRKDGR